eukprot:CAMPEP_0115218382 /NCGR_PEP_ID=MMETSP0270-20121206/26365_1 /TAXON_ID=71861 /ORGANISM="Scrippsiella trochoidea, Strain CCMP3099" /LENGTH=85 /DNA_ID=CAMNT_0002632329 /DNA_START=1 /DNA_END=255 /DNA_ORIENTATION=+
MCVICTGLAALVLMVLAIVFLIPGPPSTTTTPGGPSLPFDCNAGFDTWKAGWSIDKKAWCCEHAGKGCPPPRPPTSTAAPPGTYD